MTIVKIIPYASHTQRDSIPVSAGTLVTKDQRLINCYPEVVKNPITGKISVSIKRRPGFIAAYSGAGSPFVPSALGVLTGANTSYTYHIVAYFRPSTVQETRIYLTNTYVANIPKVGSFFDWLVRRIDSTAINGVAISVLSVGIGFNTNTSLYFYPHTLFPSAPVFSATFSGATHTNTTIDGIASTSTFYVGQALSGTGIVAGTRIATVVDGTTITTTIATTASATVTITREILAKVIDADFPATHTGGFVFLGGFAYFMTLDGKIYNFDLNSLTSLNPSNYESADQMPDGGVGLIRHGDEIIAFGTTSLQFYYNRGDATGSPLAYVEASTVLLGCESEYGYCKVGERTAFISIGASGKAIWLITGRTPQKISTSREDVILNSLAEINDSVTYDNIRWVLSSGIMDGQLMLFVISEMQTVGLAYCVESGAWIELSATCLYQIVSTGVGDTARTFIINKSNANGFLQRLPERSDSTISYKDAATYASAGSVPTATIILDLGDMDNPMRKFNQGMMALDADTQSATSNVAISTNDKDFSSPDWTTPRNVDTTKERKELYRNGSFIHRAIKLTHADDTGMRIRKLYVDIR